MRKLAFWAFTVLVIFMAACDKQDNQPDNPVPYVKVSFTVYLTDPANKDLLNRGHSILIDGKGNKGIIVVHDIDDNYWAYDRTCPYHVNSSCGKIVQFGNDLVCGDLAGSTYHPCCDSKYALAGGDVERGPSTHGLRKYTVGVQGTELYITN